MARRRIRVRGPPMSPSRRARRTGLELIRERGQPEPAVHAEAAEREARRVVAHRRTPGGEGEGVALVGGELVDPGVVRAEGEDEDRGPDAGVLLDELARE